MKLTHINEQGRGKMVDISDKKDNSRYALAKGRIYLKSDTIALLKQGKIKKGDVLSIAQVAAIMGAKKTADIIPMCHNIIISGVDVHFEIDEEKSCVEIAASAKTIGKTGIEMEALVAVSIAALTIYDMCKAVDKTMVISDIRLCEKSGGKSGDYKREE